MQVYQSGDSPVTQTLLVEFLSVELQHRGYVSLGQESQDSHLRTPVWGCGRTASNRRWGLLLGQPSELTSKLGVKCLRDISEPDTECFVFLVP